MQCTCQPSLSETTKKNSEYINLSIKNVPLPAKLNTYEETDMTTKTLIWMIGDLVAGVLIKIFANDVAFVQKYFVAMTSAGVPVLGVVMLAMVFIRSVKGKE